MSTAATMRQMPNTSHLASSTFSIPVHKLKVSKCRTYHQTVKASCFTDICSRQAIMQCTTYQPYGEYYACAINTTNATNLDQYENRTFTCLTLYKHFSMGSNFRQQRAGIGSVLKVDNPMNIKYKIKSHIFQSLTTLQLHLQ